MGDRERGSALRDGWGAIVRARSSACVAVLAAVLGVAFTPIDTVAQVLDAPDSCLRLTVHGDAPTIILSVLALTFPPTLDESIRWREPALRDRIAVNAFDRVATHRWSTAVSRASDVLLWGGVAGAFGVSAIEALVHRHTVRKWAIQGVVMAQSILVAAGLTQVTKYAVRRARPLFFNPSAPRSARAETDANLSFPSGHTSMVAAALTSLAVVEWLDEPGSGLAWGATVAAGLVVPTVAALRVAAGRHFPSDVLAGGAIGIAAGVAVPLLHRFKPAGEGRSLRLDPLVLRGGSGAVATLTW